MQSTSISEKRIFSTLRAANFGPTPLTRKRLWAWQQMWRSVYSIRFHENKGKWILGDYDWHVFSHAYYPCRVGNEAWDHVSAIQTVEFVVASAWKRQSFGFDCWGKPDKALSFGVDILVAPPSLDWTIAFTHSPGTHGPYFAER
jgi:hypothetical protein